MNCLELSDGLESVLIAHGLLELKVSDPLLRCRSHCIDWKEEELDA